MQNYYLQTTVIAVLDESEFPLYLGVLVSHLYCAHCLTAFLAERPKPMTCCGVLTLPLTPANVK